MSDIGLYIHIPFCARKCYYCDFVSSRTCDGDISRYIDALIKEIVSYSDKLKNDRIRTVFIGGGTPSYIDKSHIERIMSTVKECFNADISEATIECNPESVTEEKLIAYRAAGLNRISIGVQSLSNNLLSIIGRIHDNDTAIKAVAMAKKYFDNVSADLMIGLPMQSYADVEYAMKTLCDMDINHMSVYGLTVESGTPMAKMVEDEIVYINEDLTADLYESAVSYLSGRGYGRYEISNFCKDGCESKHNFAYWQRVPYIGVGVAAYGFYNNFRYNNYCDRFTYVKKIEEGASPVQNSERVSRKDAMTETVMLSLRTRYGLDIERFNREFDCDFLIDKSEALAKNKQFLNIENNILTINTRYYYISNAILSDLI